MRSKTKIEFGDFQTPLGLAREVCALLRGLGERPESVLEPTCGQGAFLEAATEAFPDARLFGHEINGAYLEVAASRVPGAQLSHGDFFEVPWSATLAAVPGPLLILGNPPWVTVSRLGRLSSGNQPGRANFKNLSGLDALTGRSNFDISEWMLLELVDALGERPATIALLIKSTVQRHAVEHLVAAGASSVAFVGFWRISAPDHFGASVNAGLLVLRTGAEPHLDCPVYEDLTGVLDHVVGVRDGGLLADVRRWSEVSTLLGGGEAEWRSGVKHDCARVFELRRESGVLRNGLGEVVEVEAEHLYPLIKSTGLSKGQVEATRRWVVMPQKRVGAQTEQLRDSAPKLWAYLTRHADKLGARKSKVYTNNPPFSVFGVGDYTFSPWKVAVSGLHKKIRFCALGPIEGKPAICDDTCYLLPCEGEKEARGLAEMLNGDRAVAIWEALVFRDTKRPVTKSVLGRVSLEALSESCRDLGRRSGGRAC